MMNDIIFVFPFLFFLFFKKYVQTAGRFGSMWDTDSHYKEVQLFTNLVWESNFFMFF